MGDAKPADDVSPYEVFDLRCCNSCQWFGLNPLGEIINSYQEKFALPFPGGKGPIMSITHISNGHGGVMQCNVSGRAWARFPNS